MDNIFLVGPLLRGKPFHSGSDRHTFNLMLALIRFYLLCSQVLSIIPFSVWNWKLVYPSVGFPGGSDSKESPCNAGAPGLVPGMGRSPGKGNGYPFRYSCLENSMDRGGWRAWVQGITKVTWLHDWVTNIFTFHSPVKYFFVYIVSVQFSSVTQPCPTLRLHESQHVRPPCPSPTPGVYSNSCPSSWWCHPSISSSVIPFSCPQSLPASGSFPMSQPFMWGSQSI